MKLIKIRATVKLLIEGLYDLNSYRRCAAFLGDAKAHRIGHLESDIIRRYHVIEKGLCMPDFRPRFGGDVVRQLMDCLLLWKEEGYELESCEQVSAAVVALEQYRNLHERLGINVDDIISRDFLLDFSSVHSCVDSGVRSLPKQTSQNALAFSEFFLSRFSVRHFDCARLLSAETVLDAIKTARKTPSVCNRQAWRVHAYNGELKDSLLEIQNGNRGFGHQIPMLLVITVDMALFTGVVERYQPWIDGGMFAMSLMLALHSLGVSSVALNWAVCHSSDTLLHCQGAIPDKERVVMLLGCGYAHSDAKVPVSFRSSAESFFHDHTKPSPTK